MTPKARKKGTLLSRLKTVALAEGGELKDSEPNLSKFHRRLEAWLSEDRKRVARYGTYSYGSVRNYVGGHRKAPDEFLAAVAAAFGRRLGWLKNGEGEEAPVDRAIHESVQAAFRVRHQADDPEAAEGAATVFRGLVAGVNRFHNLSWEAKQAILWYLREQWRRGALSLQDLTDEPLEKRIKRMFPAALAVKRKDAATAAVYATLAAEYLAMMDSSPENYGA